MSAAHARPVKPGHIFVVAAPSGTGKTTICRMLLERDPRLRLSVSHTTRAPRTGEVDGVDYHFVSTAEFRALNREGAFLEHAEYGNNLYCTSWKAIDQPLLAGDDVILEIEVQGAEQVKSRRPDANLIFLLPPSLAVLEKRLRGRGTDADDVIQRRMALDDRELDAAPLFDYAVINDDLDRAVDDVLEVMAAVRGHATERVRDRFDRAAVLRRWHAAQRGSDPSTR